MRHHRQLQWSDRLRIEAWRRVGMRVNDIAAELGVHRVTVYRELKRGVYEHTNTDLTTEMRYNPDLAERKYQEHLRAKGPEIKLGNDYELAAYLEHKIAEEKYSPNAALHEIERKNLKFKTSISSTTLYRYIDNGVFLNVSNENLPIKSKRKKKKATDKRAKRPERGPSIEKRPFDLLDRSEFGHWEMDTVVGRRGSKKVFLVLTERYSRYEIVRIMRDRTAASVVREIDNIERQTGKRQFKRIFKTITMDNGVEFADYKNIARSRTQVYFCHPYCSSERGSNENQNRLVRRHYPKGVSLSKVTKQDAQRLQDWINNYPRSIFGWNSAADIFNACVNSLA